MLMLRMEANGSAKLEIVIAQFHNYFSPVPNAALSHCVLKKSRPWMEFFYANYEAVISCHTKL